MDDDLEDLLNELDGNHIPTPSYELPGSPPQHNGIVITDRIRSTQQTATYTHSSSSPVVGNANSNVPYSNHFPQSGRRTCPERTPEVEEEQPYSWSANNWSGSINTNTSTNNTNYNTRQNASGGGMSSTAPISWRPPDRFEDEEDRQRTFNRPNMGRITSLSPNNIQGEANDVQVLSPISRQESDEILRLVTGGAPLHHAWCQGFFFAGYQPYGLQQVEGGPCGVIAAVQAFLLRNLIINNIDIMSVSDNLRKQHLLDAITDLLWQCGNGSSATILCPYDANDARSCRGVRPYVYTSKSALRRGVGDTHYSLFLAASGPGLAAFLYSVVHTRGARWIQNNDMDYANMTLIAEHGYCGQELVNLLIFGRACSNVFDGNKFVGEIREGEAKLQGAPRKGAVGMLTLYEARNDWVEVGNNLKSPVHPVWIVCAESHYSVLFAPQLRSTESESFKDGRQFDLYYFDMLAQQKDLLRITVYPNPPAMDELRMQPQDRPPIVSPNQSMIEECILTKWRGAQFNWNGSDPIR